jgi:hypothetical protein
MKYLLPASTLGLAFLCSFSLGAQGAIAAPITVHFPRTPQSNNNFSYTYNVSRTTTMSNKDVAALKALVVGPNSSELAIGLKRIVPTTLGTCSGQTLPPGAINGGKFMLKKIITGTDVAYKIRFCQPFPSSGVGDDARMASAITQTLWANLNYLPGVNNISQVDIAYSNNDCLGGSGNICWP